MSKNTKFVEFAEDSDLHGLKQISRADNGMVRRVLWGILVFVALGVLINNTAQQIISFFKFDHVTKYDINFVSNIDFPAVTVCNVNKHRRTAMTDLDIATMGPHLGFTDEDINLLHADLYDSTWKDATFPPGKDWNAILAAAAGDEYSLEDFYNRTGHQYEDLIQHCKWKEEVCGHSSWTMEYTHYGKCYTFNIDGDHALKKAGSGNGLEVVLYVEAGEYIETDHSEDLGVKFLAHSPIEPPFLKELGYGLAPGYHYLIALQQREITALPWPYGECEEDHPLTYFNNYTVPGCRIECETEAIYSKCNCRLVESPGDYPVCTVEQYDCAEEALESIEHSDECLCQNPCHAVEFSFTMSLMQLRENTVDKLRAEHGIPNSLTVDQLIAINIYFDILAAEEIEQTPAYTLLSILSDFGGTMGLWLGASILATAQLIDYLIQTCIRKCCNKNKVNANDQSTTEQVSTMSSSKDMEDRQLETGWR